jgi:hypothetical protein
MDLLSSNGFVIGLFGELFSTLLECTIECTSTPMKSFTNSDSLVGSYFEQLPFSLVINKRKNDP